MKKIPKNKTNALKPKHRQTKEYLKHYYPFLPMLISFGFLITAIFLPVHSISSPSVKGVETSELQQSILTSTNSARGNNSLGNLQMNQQLVEAAESKAKDMVRRNYWSHTTPEGNDPWTFIENNGYKYSTAGENLAYGFTNSDSIVNAWLSSPTHRDNLLNSSYTEVGIGTAVASNYQGEGPSLVVVAMYAKPLEDKTAASSNSGVLGASDTRVSLVSSSTGVTWAKSMIFVLTSLGVIYMLVSHSVGARKVLRRGELFVIRHPVLDSLIIIAISGGLILLKSSGVVL